MTNLEICNMALVRCGCEPIASLTDSQKRAVIISAQYQQTLKELLVDSPWGFATARAELSVSSVTPLYGFSFQYPLPSDCLKLLHVDTEYNYAVESGYILIDVDEAIKIKYLKLVSESAMTPAFVKALAMRLAEDVSYALVQSSALQESIAADADRYLKKARTYNSHEGTPSMLYPERQVLLERL